MYRQSKIYEAKWLVLFRSVLIGFVLFVLSGFLLLHDKVEEKTNYFTDAYAEDVDFGICGRESFALEENTFRAENLKPLNASLLPADSLIGEGGFVMQYGAEIRLNEVTGIRFKANISAELVNAVSAAEDMSFGIVIAPAFYFEKAIEIGRESDGACDYVNALEELETLYGARPALKLKCEPVLQGGGWIIQGSVVNILFNNTNLSYSAAAYVKFESGSGESSYRYACYPDTDCLSMARSVSYIATAALNDESADYGEVNRDVLRDFIRRGIDLAAGFSESKSQTLTERNVSISVTSPETALDVGEEEVLLPQAVAEYLPSEVDYGPSRTLPGLPFYYRSSAPSVIFVESTGKMIARSEGSAEISVFIGEVCATCTVVCEKAVYYTCEFVDDSGYGLLDIKPTISSVRKGEDFVVNIAVKDYENYGELSFWIDGELYTTTNGSLDFSKTVTSDCVVNITDLSSSMDYFSFLQGSVSMGSVNGSRANLPVKIILPVKTEEGETLTTISNNAFNGTTPASRCTKLKELTIPANYTSMPNNAFQYCLALEMIYLNNTSLSAFSASGIPSWQNCNLTAIYVPQGTAESYKAHAFWGVKIDCIKEYDFVNGVVLSDGAD